MANKYQHTPDDNGPLSLTPEEMKAIGEIELGPSRHEQFLNRHYKKLILGTVLFMLVATAAIVYGTWRARENAAAAASAIAAMHPGIGATNYADAYDTKALEQIPAAYPGTKSASTAELMRGMNLMQVGQVGEGKAILEGIIASTGDADLRVRAQAFLAGHAMRSSEQADLERSASLWQEVLDAGASPYRMIALLSLGDLSQLKGDTEAARLHYSRIITEAPHCIVAPIATNRLLILGVDAPVPTESIAPKSDSNNDLQLFPAGLIPEGQDSSLPLDIKG